MTLKPDFEFEKAFHREGFFYIAGVDEAGRGAWAGPVSAAAVIFPVDLPIETCSAINDSKTMTATQRESTVVMIRSLARASAVAFASSREVDALGILNATKLAMARAIAGLAVPPDGLLIDFVRLENRSEKQITPAHGDRLSLSIAAASILAKVARDRWMTRVAESAYPGYGFATHKGYGTRAHQATLAAQGTCAIHRRSYAPIRNLMIDAPGFAFLKAETR